jgi:hypothetical protein
MIPCVRCGIFYYCSTSCRDLETEKHNLECNRGLHSKNVFAGAPGVLGPWPEDLTYLQWREELAAGEVIDDTRSTRPIKYARGMYFVLGLPEFSTQHPVKELGLANFRVIVNGTMDPALLFVLRQFSWFNMPVHFREHTVTVAVEWGEVQHCANNSGVLVYCPPDPHVHFDFANWYAEVKKTLAPEIKEIQIVTHDA